QAHPAPEPPEAPRPPPPAHQGQNARDGDRRREDGDPQAQLRPQELGGFRHVCLIGRSGPPVKAKVRHIIRPPCVRATRTSWPSAPACLPPTSTASSSSGSCPRARRGC